MARIENKLSHGWAEISLHELMADTASINPKNSPAKMFELWSVPSFVSNVPEYVTGGEVGSNKQKVSPGDVLLCKINPRINRVWLVKDKGEFDQIASTEWLVLRNRALYPQFLLYLLREESFRQRFLVDLSGIGGSLTRARPRIVGQLKAKLAPANEQKRIVVRIEELQARSRRAREALEAIPDLLDQLRQSILASAFRGDLTKEWREKHPNIEPATELLKRIRAERRKRWEEAELEILKAKGLSEEKLKEAFAARRKQYKEPAPVDTSDLPELPKGWCWASCGELLYAIAYGTAKKSTYESKGIGVIRIPNILPNGSISIEDLKRTVFTDAEAAEYALHEGDILIIRSNGSIGLVGRAAVVSKLEEGLTCAGYLLRLTSLSLVDSHWLQLALSTPAMRKRIETTARSTSGVNNINSEEISSLPIPLAPQVEQTHIASAVRQQLDYLYMTDSRQLNLFSLLNNLDQSILHKAFRGELVPQDPNDEPASALLERMRQEKASAAVEPKAKAKQKGRKLHHRQMTAKLKDNA